MGCDPIYSKGRIFYAVYIVLSEVVSYILTDIQGSTQLNSSLDNRHHIVSDRM